LTGDGRPFWRNRQKMYDIPLIRPYITAETKDRVCRVLESGYLTEGPVTRELEQCFRDYIGCKHALAVSSCTVGLEIALRACGIGPGDEVIVPDYTYPATADVVAIVGATPVIVDINRDTMLMDHNRLEQALTARTKAVIPVSLFGNPLNYDALRQLKQKHNFIVIEDAACAVGAEYNGKKVGSLADISVFSLHPRKFITAGEGGIITTNDERLAQWMRSYKHFGMGASVSREGTQFERIGTNYKLSDVLAAIALTQMRHVDTLLEQRVSAAEYYKELLAGEERVIIPEVQPGGKHSFQSFCIYVDKRDQALNTLRGKGIEVQIGTYALHLHKVFQDSETCRLELPLENSSYAFNHCLALPLYFEITRKQQEKVVQELTKLF